MRASGLLTGPLATAALQTQLVLESTSVYPGRRGTALVRVLIV